MEKITQIHSILSYTNLVFLSVIVLICVGFFNKLPTHIKILSSYLTFNLAILLIAKYLWLHSMNNLFLSHINTFFEFVFLTFLYKKILINQPWIKRSFTPFILLICIILMTNTLFIEHYTELNRFARTLVQVIVICYALIYFFQYLEFNTIANKTLFNSSYHLINAAILIYYSGSLFIFFLADTTLDIMKYFWLINAILVFIFQLLVLISIWKAAFRQTKSLS